MTTSPSVLAFLATRFATSPENLATEALNFILASSASARRAMLDLCRQLGCEEAVDLSFTTQRTNANGSRPDFVGRTVSGQTPVVVEAKFWAGLTKNQPVSYLKGLPENGLLLFIAPAARADVLWGELRRRAGLNAEPGATTPPVSKYHVRIGPHLMALISWRALLEHLEVACALAEEAIKADIRQLMSLCDKMDSEAFLPLRAEELTSNVGRRVTQYCDLAERITDRLVGMGLADVNGSRATGGKGWYGKYLRFRGHGAFLHFDARRWAQYGHSPLWLAVYGRNFKGCTVEPDCLRAAGVTFYVSKGRCMVPLMLLEGVELDDIVEDVLAQVQRIMAAVPDLSASGDMPVSMPDDPEIVLP
jgi:hypothetical protein